MRLYEIRKEKKLNQEEVSSFLGMNRSTYAKWENLTSPITAEAIVKLSKFYGISTDYLLGLTDMRTVAEPEPMLKNINQEQKEAIKALLQLNSIQLAKAHGYILGLTSKNPNIFDL